MPSFAGGGRIRGVSAGHAALVPILGRGWRRCGILAER